MNKEIKKALSSIRLMLLLTAVIFAVFITAVNVKVNKLEVQLTTDPEILPVEATLGSLYEDACIACGYNEVTDYKTFGNLDSENYDIVECDNHFQITVFTHIYVKDKWNVSHWIKKTWINCEDFRNQSYPESYYPVVEYPNTYWETGHIEVI